MSRVAFGSVLTKSEIIEHVNDYVSITSVIKDCGIYVPDDIPMGTSLKIHCPFDFIHADQGHQAAMRVWTSSNAAMCFAENVYYTPTKLWAAYNDTPQYAAALDLASRKKVNLRAANTEEASPETSVRYLEQALARYCTRIVSDWELAPFKYPTSHKVFVACIKAAHQAETDEEIELWLTSSKQFMDRVLQHEV